MRCIRLYAVAVLLLAAPFCAARDVAIIADQSTAASALTGKELSKLIKTAKWPDGRKLMLFLKDPGSPDGKLFLDKGCNMTASELKSLAETSKTVVFLGSDDQVLQAVSATPGAIGVVNVFSISSAVKVLKVDGKLPLEQGYVLHGN